MAGSSFGNIFRITTFGESHGRALGVIVDGVPSGLCLNEDDIQIYLDRRRPGTGRYTTPRKESDTVEILSGVFEGKTTGTPISLIVRNENQRSGDYSAIQDVYRPGHADFGFDMKYGHRDYRGGGRSSGRETIGRVAAGAVAAKILKELNISFCTYVNQIGPVKCDPSLFEESFIFQNELYMSDRKAYEEAVKYLDGIRKEHDSSGSCVECIIRGVPCGIGDPVFEKLNANLAGAISSIGGVKAFETGDGIRVSSARGSQNNDPFLIDKEGKTGTLSNHSGGILGGISTGEDIILRAYFKPTPSIATDQQTVDDSGKERIINIKGRHDPVIGPRAAVVTEAMAAITILDAMMMNMTARVSYLKDFYNG